MGSNVRFVIITGLSGAGKSEAVRCFEDLGYFCVDNIPPTLVPKFADLCAQSVGGVNRIALVCDVRSGEFFDSLADALSELESIGFTYQILYLEASDDVLVRRFKETRRRHPLTPGGGILAALHQERRRLECVRGRAHRIINTSNLTPRQLQAEITREFGSQESDRLVVSVISFGFKHGLPLDADMVFDVRFLPNPHYVASLRDLTGNDPGVAEYVFRWPITQRFMEKTHDLIAFLLPQFVNEGKTHLILAIGCTGGQHRSVAVANRIAEQVRDMGYECRVDHRDIDEERPVFDGVM
ncbi:MAG: RNase adapter RapZ [Limnochordia bacterium]